MVRKPHGESCVIFANGTNSTTPQIRFRSVWRLKRAGLLLSSFYVMIGAIDNNLSMQLLNDCPVVILKVKMSLFLEMFTL